VRLYSAYILAGQTIAKTVQRHVIITYCTLCKPADGIFSQYFGVCKLIARFENRMLFLYAKNVVSKQK